jgi:hypothetical protein
MTFSLLNLFINLHNQTIIHLWHIATVPSRSMKMCYIKYGKVKVPEEILWDYREPPEDLLWVTPEESNS